MGRHDHTPSPGALSTTWRQRAQFLQDYGDPNSARLWQLAATELDAALRVLDAATLTLVEAAALSGYSQDHLGSLVRKGQIRNVGRKNAPRILRAHLPIKSSSSPDSPVTRRRKTAAEENITNIAKKLSPRR